MVQTFIGLTMMNMAFGQATNNSNQVQANVEKDVIKGKTNAPENKKLSWKQS